MPLVSHVHLPVLLAGHVAIRQCWPIPALSGLLAILTHVPGLGLPPASSSRRDGITAAVSHRRAVKQRLVALGIADPKIVRRLFLKTPIGSPSLTFKLMKCRPSPGEVTADRTLGNLRIF